MTWRHKYFVANLVTPMAIIMKINVLCVALLSARTLATIRRHLLPPSSGTDFLPFSSLCSVYSYWFAHGPGLPAISVPHFSMLGVFFTQNTESACPFETLIMFYQIAQLHIPEDSNLRVFIVPSSWD
jgi:hypothetical protein